MVAFDSRPDEAERGVKPRAEVKEQIEELQGAVGKQQDHDSLMHSVFENDKEVVENGMMLAEASNRGLGMFIPDMIFSQLVKNFRMAKTLYGDNVIRNLSEYDVDYVEKNLPIPEFQRELKERLEKKVDKLKAEGLISEDGSVAEKGVTLSALVMCFEELDRLIPKGIEGETVSRRNSVYGDKYELSKFSSGSRYRDISVKQSVKVALRRGHSRLTQDDLRVHSRIQHGSVYLVYAVDASGSMRGEKIGRAKKAGIALAYKAIESKDKVGLLVFGSEVTEAIPPTDDFMQLARSIARAKASRQTNLAATITKAVEIFPEGNHSKHLILITDALPTTGAKPEDETMSAVANARSAGITISVVGISLDAKGVSLAERMATLGEGRFYVAREDEELDTVVLEDYYSL